MLKKNILGKHKLRFFLGLCKCDVIFKSKICFRIISIAHQITCHGLENWKKRVPINKPAPVIHYNIPIFVRLFELIRSQKQNETNNVFSMIWSLPQFAYGSVGDLEECGTSGFLDKFLFYFESLTVLKRLVGSIFRIWGSIFYITWTGSLLTKKKFRSSPFRDRYFGCMIEIQANKMLEGALLYCHFIIKWSTPSKFLERLLWHQPEPSQTFQ